MKRIFSILLAMAMLLSLAACKQKEDAVPTGTEPTTEPVADEMEHFDLNNTDLDSIGELLAERNQEDHCKLQLDGLCTPVILELEGTDIVSISAYGNTVFPDRDNEYTSIYGNLWPVIYDHEGMIFLNIWHDDIGYTCVMRPDGNYVETYPDEETSVMIYVDEEGRVTQSRFAMKFQAIEQWDTGPIDMAVSRDDFYYSIDDAGWTEENDYFTVSREYHTISDQFDLDEIFSTARANGLYPEFETLEELLDYNAQRFAQDESDEDTSGSDSVQDSIGYFDQIFQTLQYDDQRNLVTETLYDQFGNEYFKKTHTYDAQGRETAGSWCFQGEEIYRYTNTYGKNGLPTETIWYQADQEVERFVYTHNSKGGYTKTFFQNGQKKYTYTFDETGELTGHSVYAGDKEIKTEDLSSLVRTELLTDIWFPFMDNDTIHSPYRYNGTVPTQAPANALKMAAADGGYVLVEEGVDEEFDEAYRHEYHYSANDKLLRASHIWEGVESYRDEYQYDSNGLCIQQVTYIDGEKDMTCDRQYNEAGQLSKEEQVFETPQSYYTYTDENVEKEVTYTVKAETYRYNDQGLLAECVTWEDGAEVDRTAYAYDAYGYVLPRLDTYQYVYNVEGVLEGVWLIYDDHAAGLAQLRSHTVYVTPENARQLQEIMRNELSWF